MSKDHPRDPVKEALWLLALRSAPRGTRPAEPTSPSVPIEEQTFDRREILEGGTRLAIGGVLGGILASSLTGCRTPQVYREPPTGVPTGYIIDPAICTHNFDCERVCPCGAIGFTEEDAASGDTAECRTCWVNLDKCCACGRCFRVCPDNAIVACYGPDKIPAREIGRAKEEK